MIEQWDDWMLELAHESEGSALRVASPRAAGRVRRVGYDVTIMDALVIQRAAEEWAPTPDDLALGLVCDDAAYLRAWGQRETRTLDTALRIKRAQVERVLLGEQRRQLAAARATLGHK